MHPPPEKSYPLFSSNPLLKVDVLSSLPLWKFGEVQPPSRKEWVHTMLSQSYFQTIVYKLEIRSPKHRRSPRNSKFSQPLAMIKKFSLHKKILMGGGVYTMDNKDTNKDYEKAVRVGYQKWETIDIIFFCLRFVFTGFYKGGFQVPHEIKNQPHLQC